MRKFFISAAAFVHFMIEYTLTCILLGAVIALLERLSPGSTSETVLVSFCGGFLLVFFGSGLLIFLLEGPREIKLWLDHRKGRAILRKS